MAASTLLFDLDGTIWDSFPWYAQLLTNGASCADIVQRLRSGCSIVSLHSEYGVTKTQFRRICAFAGDLPALYPEVPATLEALRQRGTALAIVTSLPNWVELVLSRTGLDQYFRAVIHAGNCTARKPNPKPLHSALRILGRDAGPEVFYVGDRSDDARAAARAGISFAWASYGYGEEPNYLTARLDTFAEVLDL